MLKFSTRKESLLERKEMTRTVRSRVVVPDGVLRQYPWVPNLYESPKESRVPSIIRSDLKYKSKD